MSKGISNEGLDKRIIKAHHDFFEYHDSEDIDHICEHEEYPG
jgi:hypothetical protein